MLCIILGLAAWKLGPEALIPVLYGVVAGYYFLHMEARLREPEDVEIARFIRSVVGLVPTALVDLCLRLLRWLKKRLAQSFGERWVQTRSQ